MDEARFLGGHFKNEAFRWKTVFTRRQTVVYRSENNRHLRDGVSKLEVLDRFVDNRCTDDPGRHLSRRFLLGSFLNNSDVELFHQPPDPSIFQPRILLDDRNDESVSGIIRTQPSGKCRQLGDPLTAHQLYSELIKQVVLIPAVMGKII